LSEAVERGVLAGFEIDVLEIRDPDPIPGLSEDALRGRPAASRAVRRVRRAGGGGGSR